MPFSPKNLTYKIGALTFVLYLSVLFKFMIFNAPFSFLKDYLFIHFNAATIHHKYIKANFIPFKTIYFYLSGEEPFQPTMENLVGNIVLFIPFGFLLPSIVQKELGYRKVILAVFLTSLSFEIVQLFITQRVTDVDDILLNCVGGLIGYRVFSKYEVRGTKYEVLETRDENLQS